MTRILLALLAFYRRWISPALHVLGGGGGGCRFVPTCSEYATIAIATHGPIRGSSLAIWRLLRCHPFCRGGLDPVPTNTKQMLPVRKQKGQTGTTAAHLPHEPLP
jgi:putative membrane protein insertion efficiency factor